MPEVSRRSFILGGALALLSYSFLEVDWLKVTRYEVPVKDLPQPFDGFTILHLSDLHGKEYGAHQERLLSLVHEQVFDLVAITGDWVNKRKPDPRPGIDLVRQLTAKPVYFVPGNHDWWSGFDFKDDLLKAGVRVLENQAQPFPRGEEHLWVIGVDDPYLGRDDLGSALAMVDDAAPKLLLTHAPNIYPAAVESAIDVVMAGHTHGGQIRLPFVGALVVPGQGLFPELDYGLFTAGKTSMVINGGLGESVLPVRFNARPEIVLITLRSMPATP